MENTKFTHCIIIFTYRTIYSSAQKKLFDFLSGSGTGLLVSSFYSPDTIRHTAVMVIGVGMILLSWYFKSKFDKRILQTIGNTNNQAD